MFNEMSISLISLIYVAVLSVVYFLKRKYTFLETKIYKIILILTIIILVMDVANVYLLENYNLYGPFFSKLYILLLLVWLIIFISYILLNRDKDKHDNLKKTIQKSNIAQAWSIIAIIFTTLLLILPIKYQISPIYYYGLGVNLVYILGIGGSLFLLLLLIISNKHVASYKNWSMLSTIVILCLTIMIQMNTNQFFIIGSGLSVITVLLYFTMESPDLKYIDELNSLKLAAEEANKAKTDFLASMSHEIRTPMNAIIGLSQSLLTSNIPSEIYEDIKNIGKAGDTLLEIVNNILDITKIEEGKTNVTKKVYNLADTIAELKNLVEVSLEEKPIKFTVETIGNIPSRFNGDEVKVYQILMNILSNAVKYTKKGSIKLTIESRIFGNKANLTFKVIDTGIGIKKEDSDKIFQKFERLDQEKKNIQGTGLGLAITKKLLDMLGGKISFTSVYQKGTTFIIEIPQEIASKEKIKDFASYKAKRKTVDEYFDGSQYNILLVDDNLLNLKVAEKLLKKYNLKVTSVKSGVECISKTKTNKYDLIFLDHMMPEMDGIHTLYHLQRRASGFDTPVVVLTANAIEGSKEMYLREGFCDYLSKPINQVELDNILRKYLNINEGE